MPAPAIRLDRRSIAALFIGLAVLPEPAAAPQPDEPERRQGAAPGALPPHQRSAP